MRRWAAISFSPSQNACSSRMLVRRSPIHTLRGVWREVWNCAPIPKLWQARRGTVNF